MRYAFINLFLFFTIGVSAQSFVLYQGDTINVVDHQNRKQGLWLSFNDKGDKIVEQGKFVSNQKEGLWITYYPNGNVKHRISYQGGKAIGPAQFYYENGLLSEEGNWHIDHWQGNYRFYNISGSLAYDWNYDEDGQRSGAQKYYHDNGTLKYSGVWKKGKATGTLRIYDDGGRLITERVYDDGEFRENVAVTTTVLTDERAPQQVAAVDRTVAEFNGTGQHTVYNLKGQAEKQGFFVNGKIFTGTHSFYDEDHQLIKVVHYQNGDIVKTEDKL